ncbi:quercetin 2,3-dioxygenase [Blastococcus capsensis]|uniref:quercetin 2,3-dioxygenase n=1 Tax=Blastococcus capsensis TaxID=1564163 RepID=UPI0025415B3F|nr:quercetin 2,3-dioxygenase [Blastococcus capsensis]MDK3255292.1 quercetin 2,3-dioxygenase [Blastococcus capsensis]
MPDPLPTSPLLLRAGEGRALWFLGNLVTVKAGGPQTDGGVTVVEFLNPPGFAPPLHRHLDETEMFQVLEGSATFTCGTESFTATPGDFVLLPAGVPHTFVVAPDGPLRTLQITTPAGFERFAAAVGAPATERRLPDPAPVDPAALAHAGELHGVEILGPPPVPAGP